MRLSVFFKKERSLKNRRHDRASTTLSEYSPGWWYDILSQLLNFFLFLFWFSNLKLFYFFPKIRKCCFFRGTCFSQSGYLCGFAFGPATSPAKLIPSQKPGRIVVEITYGHHYKTGILRYSSSNTRRNLRTSP